MGGGGLFSAVVDIEARVFPGEAVGEFGRTDEFGLAEGMEEAVPGRSTAETMTMLLEGVETIDGAGEGKHEQDHGPDVVGLWKCVRVSPGVELHLSCDLPKPKSAAFRKLVSDLDAALRRNL